LKQGPENHVRLTANWHGQFLPCGPTHCVRLS
jgi:hypothetical protein